MNRPIESPDLEIFSKRRLRRFELIVKYLFTLTLLGLFVSLPGFWLDATQQTMGRISLVSLSLLAFCYGVAWWATRSGRQLLASALLFGGALAYGTLLLLLYRPDHTPNMLGTLYFATGTLLFASNMIVIVALELWHRARLWLGLSLATYILVNIVLFLMYHTLMPQPELFVTMALVCLLLLICVVGFSRAFTRDLNDLFAQSEAARALEVVHREQSEALRDEALQANRSKSQFLANMSHELRTPLSAILGYVELIREEAEGGESLDFEVLDGDLAQIKSAASHLHGLIDDILDLSKIEAGKLELYQEHFPVTRLLHDLEATIVPLISRHDNRFTLDDTLPEALTFFGDEVRLRQILLNLLSNAAKFTQEGQITLRVWLEEAAHTLCFEVRDSGIGIPQEKLKQIFEPFEQVDGSTTRKYGGTGLGLPISSRLAQMMGGQILVRSSPGQGASFTLQVPMRDRAAIP